MDSAARCTRYPISGLPRRMIATEAANDRLVKLPQHVPENEGWKDGLLKNCVVLVVVFLYHFACKSRIFPSLKQSVCKGSLVLHFQVSEAPGVHAKGLDWEDELVVRVGDHAVRTSVR